MHKSLVVTEQVKVRNRDLTYTDKIYTYDMITTKYGRFSGYIESEHVIEGKYYKYDDMFDDELQFRKDLGSDEVDEIIETLKKAYEVYYNRPFYHNLNSHVMMLEAFTGKFIGSLNPLDKFLLESAKEFIVNEKGYNLNKVRYATPKNSMKSLIFKSDYPIIQGTHYKGLKLAKHVNLALDLDTAADSNNYGYFIIDNVIRHDLINEFKKFINSKLYDYAHTKEGLIDLIDASLQMDNIGVNIDSGVIGEAYKNTMTQLKLDNNAIANGTNDKLKYYLVLGNPRREIEILTLEDGNVVDVSCFVYDTLQVSDDLFKHMSEGVRVHTVRLFNDKDKAPRIEIKDNDNINDYVSDESYLMRMRSTGFYLDVGNRNQFTRRVYFNGDGSLVDGIEKFYELEFHKNSVYIDDSAYVKLENYVNKMESYFNRGVFNNSSRKNDLIIHLNSLKKALKVRKGNFRLSEDNYEVYQCSVSKDFFIMFKDNYTLPKVYDYYNKWYVLDYKEHSLKKFNIKVENVKGTTRYVKEGNLDKVERNVNNIVKNDDLFKYFNELQKYRQDYSYKPSRPIAIVDGDDGLPKVVNINNVGKSLLYGIELEFDYDYLYDLDDEDDIDMNEVISVSNHILTQGLPSLYSTYDGSLDLGFESKTVPVSYNTLLNPDYFDWDSYFDYIIGQGFSGENDTCGLHIHVSKNYFNLPNVDVETMITFSTGMLATVLENNSDFLISFSRRDYDKIEEWASFNEFSKHNKLSDYLTSNDPLIAKRYMRRVYNSVLERRYSALNVHHSPTFEFRIFRGVDNKDTLIDTIKLVNLIVENVKDMYVRYMSIDDNVSDPVLLEKSRNMKLDILRELDNFDLEKEFDKICA